MDRKMLVGTFMVVFTVMLSSFSFYIWQIIYSPNILVGKEDQYFAIYPDQDFKTVQNQLYESRIVNDMVSFGVLAKLKKYNQLVKPGLYLLKADMTNIEAINLLRSGDQTPVELTFTQARKLEELPEKIANYMLFEEEEFGQLLLNDTTATFYGFDQYTFISMFIPNTYEVYWTDTPKELLDRMKREYEKFWNETRRSKAAEMGLSPHEIATLASIVEGETKKMDEAPKIAGVYINRLKRGIKLQADPTLVYAVGDFTIRRVLNVHKQVNSPFNTYLYAGLPPGPIALPSGAAIDAVLNYEQHGFIYFCAKDDFSGYHVFAKTLIDHNENARKFQMAMDRERIFK